MLVDQRSSSQGTDWHELIISIEDLCPITVAAASRPQTRIQASKLEFQVAPLPPALLPLPITLHSRAERVGAMVSG